MDVVFITSNYPSPARPHAGAFVRQFVHGMNRQGNGCTVVCPTSYFALRYGRIPTTFDEEQVPGGGVVVVHRPRYLSFSSRRLGWTHTGRWTELSFRRAALRVVRALPVVPDVAYGHFLYHAGRTAVIAGLAAGIPSVVGVGEGEFWSVAPFGFDRARRDFAPAAGILAVSSPIRDALHKQIGVPYSKMLLEPNGVDRSVFAPASRQDARARLGLDPSAFLVACVGEFTENKGVPALARATLHIDGIGLLLLGAGPAEFPRDKVVHAGRVPHGDVPVWLNAGDVFALPTRIEGSCNSVLEAMACGLPIVTARGAHMDDLVDDDVALRVDPTDVAEIRLAIQALKDDPERRARMAAAAVEKARRFDINARAQRVTQWMQGLPGGRRR